ncbi:MAG TPA: class I SAM-dependent methyltransferase [Planctomycetota bacterium]|nr:class I SAM-dependent methyltransferase [Planctomycetota bacterium]
MSPLYNTSRDDLAPLWPEFKLDIERISVVDAADAGQDRPCLKRVAGDVLIAQVGYSPDVATAVRTYQKRGDSALAPDGTAMLFLKDPRPDAEIVRWRNALWPWLQVTAHVRLTPGKAVIETLGGSETKPVAIQKNGHLLVARRREQVLSPAITVSKFDKNSGGWNPTAGSRGWGHYRWGRHFVGRFAPVRAGARVLDFGCGAGWCGIEAALTSPGSSLALFDPSPDLAEGAGANARAAGIQNVSVRTGFGESPPFPAAGEPRFDHVISSGVVSFSPDFPRWFDGLASTLAPGGTLVIGDLNRESKGMRSRRARKLLLVAREMNALTRDEARTQLESRGFKFVKAAGYQLTSPWPEAMHVSDHKLGGLLSPLILALNKLSAGDGNPERFDSWVMQLSAP